MILQALVDYYEEMASQGRIPRPGWSKVKVSWALEIGDNGELLDVLPLRHPSENGKKMIPREMELPTPGKRSGTTPPPNYLCDNTQYVLGIEKGEITEKSQQAFLRFAELHERKLSGLDDPMAKAIVSFVKRYSPKDLISSEAITRMPDILEAGGNIVFVSPEGLFAHEKKEIRATVQPPAEEDEPYEVCLVTGEKAPVSRIHGSIKGLRGNSPNGWTLVGFNADSFCSYGKKQSYNAPVSKYAAFAYTTALNQLLADRKHVKVIGNTTVVYWAKDAELQYQDVFAALFDGGDETVSSEELNALMDSVAAGKPYKFDGLPVSPENDFFILGISPNAARLSVRFFYRRSFGEIVQNLKRHYDNVRIVSDGRNKWEDIPLWALLRETVNQKSSDKSPLPQLAGDVTKSMLAGGRYPETLMNQVMLRIRAEHEITRGKAGIIKAYLIRNTENLPNRESIMEVANVSLNEESAYTPYVLGRLFAVLEGTQQAANPGINATIKDRFFNSACATPAAVFPILLKLSNSHLKKLDQGKSAYWSKQIGTLIELLGMDFPAHQTLQEQGAFILGYYHQTQKRFEKKNNTDNREEN